MTIIVHDRQTIFDLAVQFYGDVSGVFALLTDNPSLPGLNTVLTPGQKIQIVTVPVNLKMKNVFTQKQLVPVTKEGSPSHKVPFFGDYNIDYNNDFFNN